jgi:hypothetical protein
MLDKPRGLIQLAVLGVSLEGFWLAMYIVVSSTNPSESSKTTILISAALSLVVLIYYSVTRLKRKRDLVLLLLILSFGYVGAFHLLGLLFFRGLLSDADLSFEYMRSLLGVAVVLLAIYLLVALVLYWLNALSRRSAVSRSD